MNEATFLDALHESPNDELTWLALADWLEENGQNDRAELARIVRRLHAMPATKRRKKGTEERPALEKRLIALLDAGVRPVVPEMTNSAGMRLALIPPGRFLMGSPGAEKERQQNERTREVEIIRAYYLGVCTVTQAQYRAVMNSNPSIVKREAPEVASYPVENVTWLEAVAFCEKLTEIEANDSGYRYRLPTEAEWEYACRACTTSAFHFGDRLSASNANINGAHPYGEAESGPFLERPSVVGSYVPNAFGMYDMHGNVWEWCADWLEDYDPDATRDPVGASEGIYRVMRGGSWRGAAGYCRSAKRGGGRLEFHFDYLGFRVAAEARSADRVEAT